MHAKSESARPRRSLLAEVSTGQWLALVFAVLALIFVLSNRGKVRIEFLLVTVTSPLWLILLIMFVIGVLSGALLTRRKGRAPR
ncbi:lipopolysaccharide assembly protein LapA domain-containing protein [Nocardia jiangsuensis]|uniref:Lipopolysaccharide assembly protein LapA domain-containing protein n=1 Tax=Nocardia jiangsuensis TaxID=1691563 RepID=A0ABV8DZC8_9NOCA